MRTPYAPTGLLNTKMFIGSIVRHSSGDISNKTKQIDARQLDLINKLQYTGSSVSSCCQTLIYSVVMYKSFSLSLPQFAPLD